MTTLPLEQLKALREGMSNKYTVSHARDKEAVNALPTILDMLIEQLEWIPVSERLPEKTTDLVLVLWADGDILVREASYLPEYVKYKYASHWKPLPAPPEGEQG